MFLFHYLWLFSLSRSLHFHKMGKDKQQTKVEDFSENLHVTKPCQPVQKVTGIPTPRPEPRDMPPPPFDVCEESEKVKCSRKPCEDPVVPCCTKKQPPKPFHSTSTYLSHISQCNRKHYILIYSTSTYFSHISQCNRKHYIPAVLRCAVLDI